MTRHLTPSFWEAKSRFAAVLTVIAALSAALPGPAHAQASGEVVQSATALLGALDKITARLTEVPIDVGTAAEFERLEIEVYACQERTVEQRLEIAAFLRILETRPNGEVVPVFSGWMFANSPGLSAMDHAIYDVWLVDCLAAQDTEATPEE